MEGLAGDIHIGCINYIVGHIHNDKLLMVLVLTEVVEEAAAAAEHEYFAASE